MTGLTLTSASGAGPGQAVALAILLVAAPLFAGLLLGGVLRRWRWGVVVGVLAATVLTLAGVEGVRQVGVWDTIAAGALFATGLVFGSSDIDRRSAVTLVASSALAFAGLESASRWWLPPPQQFPNPSDAALKFETEAWDAGCAVLYGDDVDDDVHVLRRVVARPKTREHPPLVVHLGDSMTYGEGVKAQETFPALLDARDPGVMHRNYGVWAVGTDFEYLLLERILDVHSPVMVVLHVYPDNDIYDIDRPYACCDAGPLLDYGSGEPTARCETASWRFPLAFRLSRSPPPYPLRIATYWSHAARHAAAEFSRLVSAFEPRSDFILTAGEASESGWQHFEQILTHLHDELPPNVELVVDLLPDRQALESVDPTASPSSRARKRIAMITAQLGIRTLDAWDVFANAVKSNGSRRYFRDERDIHFTPEGHRLLADWLETQLSSAVK